MGFESADTTPDAARKGTFPPDLSKQIADVALLELAPQMRAYIIACCRIDI